MRIAIATSIAIAIGMSAAAAQEIERPAAGTYTYECLNEPCSITVSEPSWFGLSPGRLLFKVGICSFSSRAAPVVGEPAYTGSVVGGSAGTTLTVHRINDDTVYIVSDNTTCNATAGGGIGPYHLVPPDPVDPKIEYVRRSSVED